MPRLLVAFAFLTAVHAQENTVQVPPGREIREHKLLSLGQTDVWKLDVKKDEMLWCIVDSSAFDPVLELSDQDNHRLGQDDGAGLRSELWLRMAGDGPVEFRVHGFQGSGGGQYQFWLQRFRTEPLPSHGESTHRFGKEQWWHFRVAMQQGEILVPALQGEGRVTAVFDELRNAVPDDHGGFQAQHPGDFFVRVEGREEATCHVTTQLARQREWADAPIDDVVPPYGFEVFYLRHLPPGTAWVIDLAMPATALEFDPREAAAETPAFAWPGHLDKGGRRYRLLYVRHTNVLALVLRNRTGDGAPFRMAVEPWTAALQPGAPINASLLLGRAELYRCQLSAGDLIRLRLSSRAFDARLDVWDPDGNVIAQGIDDRGPLDRDAEHTFLVSRPGCYRVLAYCNGGAGSGDYTLQAEVLEVPQLEPGASLPVKLQNGGTSYLHLRLQAGQEVWLSVRSRAFDAGLTVLDPAGDAGFHCEGGGRGGDVLTAYVASHTGVHTLLVHSRGGSGDGEVRVVVP